MSTARRQKAWRLKYREGSLAAGKQDRDTMRRRHVAFVGWLRHGICQDCREPSNELEFDHVRGPKLFNIGSVLRQRLSWTQLVEEAMKCDRVCPDCHLERTRSRGHAWRPGDAEAPF